MSEDIFDLFPLKPDLDLEPTDVRLDVAGHIYGHITVNFDYKPDLRIEPDRNPKSSVNDLVKLFATLDGICVITFIDRVRKKAIQLSRTGSGRIELNVVTLPASSQ